MPSQPYPKMSRKISLYDQLADNDIEPQQEWWTSLDRIEYVFFFFLPLTSLLS